MRFSWFKKKMVQLQELVYGNFQVASVILGKIFIKVGGILIPSLSYILLSRYAAVVREVKEETGIDSTFQTLVAIMEGHRGSGPTRESASDLYCVCVLKANDESQSIRMQESELERSDWVPVEQALSHHRLVYPSTAFGQMYRTALSIALHLNDKNSTPIAGCGLSQSVLPFGIGNRQVNVMQVEISQHGQEK
jgi:hypothetical protein